MRIEQKYSYLIILVIIANVLKGIIRNDDVWYYISYVGILFIPFLLLNKFKIRDDIKSIIFFLASILAIVLGHPTALNDGIFLGISLAVLKGIDNSISKKARPISIILYAIAFMIRYTILNFNASDIFLHFCGVTLVILTIDDLVASPVRIIKPIERPSNSIYVPADIVNFMHLRTKDCEWNDISDIMQKRITGGAARKKVRLFMNENGFKNHEAFAAYLIKSGYFRSILGETNNNQEDCGNVK